MWSSDRYISQEPVLTEWYLAFYLYVTTAGIRTLQHLAMAPQFEWGLTVVRFLVLFLSFVVFVFVSLCWWLMSSPLIKRNKSCFEDRAGSKQILF
jgi:hypothetical protein